jgi:hypothetical protein
MRQRAFELFYEKFVRGRRLPYLEA